VRMTAFDFPCRCETKTLGSAFMCFEFRHYSPFEKVQ
jgi:hypothetical protein